MKFSELLKLICTEENAEVLDSRREEMADVIPELRTMFEYDQRSQYHQFDLWQHTLQVLAGIPRGNKDRMLYLTALLHDIGKPLTQSKGKRPDDPYMHYIGHDIVGAKLIEESILPRIYNNGELLTIFEHYRLIYYVRYHDKTLSSDPEKNGYLFEGVDNECVVSLMQLIIADCKAHIMTDQLEEKIERCNFFIVYTDQTVHTARRFSA